jgi:hypothetical protein
MKIYQSYTIGEAKMPEKESKKKNILMLKIHRKEKRILFIHNNDIFSVKEVSTLYSVSVKILPQEEMFTQRVVLSLTILFELYFRQFSSVLSLINLHPPSCERFVPKNINI